MIKHLIKVRGIRNTFVRLFYIIKRFSTTENMEKALYELEKYNLTIPITATILNRYYRIIKKYKNIDFAIHGFIHIDYTKLNFDKQLEHLIKAIDVFNRLGIKFYGFRAPYTRCNNETIEIIKKDSHFLWDSSKQVIWDVIKKEKMNKAYKKVIEYYTPIQGENYKVLPEIIFNDKNKCIVEIPLSLPDDEMLIDRLNFTVDEVKSIWNKILHITNERGELFVLQLHPERFYLLKDVVIYLLEEAKKLNIWVANLTKIANWWIIKLNNEIWPDNKKSAFAITGDIDAMHIIDFFLRIIKK